jgi:hypothetical protein
MYHKVCDGFAFGQSMVLTGFMQQTPRRSLPSSQTFAASEPCNIFLFFPFRLLLMTVLNHQRYLSPSLVCKDVFNQSGTFSPGQYVVEMGALQEKDQGAVYRREKEVRRGQIYPGE